MSAPEAGTSPRSGISPRGVRAIDVSTSPLLRSADGWSMHLSTVIPVQLVDLVPTAINAVSHGRWHCLACPDPCDKDSPYTVRSTKGVVLYVWYDPPNATLQDLKACATVQQLTHENLSTSSSLFVGLETSSAPFANLYAVNAATGHLIVWKISSKDFVQHRITTNVLPCALATIPLDLDQLPDHITSLDVGPPGTFSSMPTVVLGTSTGRIFWVKQTPSPMSLNVQEVVAGTGRSSVLARFFSPAKRPRAESSEAHVLATLLTGTNQFFVVSNTGISQWSVTTQIESGKTDFDRVRVTQAYHALVDYFSRSDSISSTIQSASIVAAAINPEATLLHALVLTQHATGLGESSPERFRLYWVVLDAASGYVVVAKWLNRFADPQSSVQVHGMLVTGQKIGYLAAVVKKLSTHVGSPPSVLFMALDEASIPDHRDVVVHEFDASDDDVRVGGLLTSIIPDVVTHGCCVLTTNGLGLRVRHVETVKEAVASRASPASATLFNPATVQTLVNHLRATFRDAYANPADIGRLPPSLHTEQRMEVEEAIVVFCRELLYSSGSDSQALMERHRVLMSVLQQGGLYRTLSNKCRWRLFGMGQQIAVFQALVCSGALDSLRTPLTKVAGVTEWLLTVELEAFQSPSVDAQQQQFIEWLCFALKAADEYRANQLLALYDIDGCVPCPTEAPGALPIWTSNLAIQTLLKRQLMRWKSQQGPSTVRTVETVVIAALQSYSDSYLSLMSTEAEEDYADIQKIAIPLLRSVKGSSGDQLAWNLCLEHRYFEGICEMAYDHELKPDREEYLLDPLFQLFCGKSCVGNAGLSFCQFVLKWHCSNNLIGHVLQYGEHCPDDLCKILEHDNQLQAYSWIRALRSGDYEKASMSLLVNARTKNLAPSLAKTEISIASLANRVAEKDGSLIVKERANIRRVEIEALRDLIDLQEEICGKETHLDRLLEPYELLDLALTRLDKVNGKEEKAHAYLQCLAICRTFASRKEAEKRASDIWLKSIQEDLRWLRDKNTAAPDLANRMLNESVFGFLLSECKDFDSSWDAVKYREVEQLIYLQIPQDLHHVLAITASQV